MDKIVIVNAHWSNRGDEAALRAVLDYILRIKKNAEIKVIFKDRKEIQQFPYKMIKQVSSQFLPNRIDYLLSLLSRGKQGRNVAMRTMVSELKTASYIIYAPGGSVINDRFWWRKQLEYLLPFWCAKIYKVPLFVAAPSIGPFDERRIWRNYIRRKAFLNADILCVREELSKSYIQRIGFKKDIRVAIDMAFATKKSTLEDKNMGEGIIEISEVEEFLNSHPRTVGITITDFEWHVKYRNDQAMKMKINCIFQQFMEWLDKSGVGVILIPQLFGNQNDRKYLLKYQGENVYVLSDELDSEYQQNLIIRLYAIIGMRYHSNIFAAKAGVPFIPIIYEEKMEGFLQLAGVEQYGIKLEEFSYELLVQKYDKMVAEYDEYKKLLTHNGMAWRKKAMKTLELLAEFLGEENE